MASSTSLATGAARLLGVDQRLTDASIQTHLDADHLTRCLVLLLMFVFGSVEQLARDAVVQVDDFVGDGGQEPRRVHSDVVSLGSGLDARLVYDFSVF